MSSLRDARLARPPRARPGTIISTSLCSASFATAEYANETTATSRITGSPCSSVVVGVGFAGRFEPLDRACGRASARRPTWPSPACPCARRRPGRRGSVRRTCCRRRRAGSARTTYGISGASSDRPGMFTTQNVVTTPGVLHLDLDRRRLARLRVGAARRRVDLVRVDGARAADDLALGRGRAGTDATALPGVQLVLERDRRTRCR